MASGELFEETIALEGSDCSYLCNFLLRINSHKPLPPHNPNSHRHSPQTLSQRKHLLTHNEHKVNMGSEETAAEMEAADNENENGSPFHEESLEDVPARVTYIDYLKSPVIGLLVGQGAEQTLLTAHQALLTTSPWFGEACAKFSDGVSVRTFCCCGEGDWKGEFDGERERE